MTAECHLPLREQLRTVSASVCGGFPGSPFARSRGPLVLHTVSCLRRLCLPPPLQKSLSLTAASRIHAAGSAVAEKPEAELSGEFGDYDDLLVRFRRADLDGNGVIDKEELKYLLETVEEGFACPTTQWIQDKEVDDVMNLYDKTGSGDITFEEFKALANDGILLKGKLGEYADAFSAADKDGNGTLEMAELGDLFKALDHPMEQQELMRVRLSFIITHTAILHPQVAVHLKKHAAPLHPPASA